MQTFTLVIILSYLSIISKLSPSSLTTLYSRWTWWQLLKRFQPTLSYHGPYEMVLNFPSVTLDMVHVIWTISFLQSLLYRLDICFRRQEDFWREFNFISGSRWNVAGKSRDIVRSKRSKMGRKWVKLSNKCLKYWKIESLSTI